MGLFLGSCLRALSSVARTAAATGLYSGRIELSTDDSIANTDVLNATSAQKYDRVLLEVVSLAWDVGSDFHAVSKADTGNLADSRVRLARGLGGHLGADAALKRCWIEGRAVFECIKATAKSGGLGLGDLVAAALLYELVYG